MIYKTKKGFIKTREDQIAAALLGCNHFLIRAPVIFIHVFCIHCASA